MLETESLMINTEPDRPKSNYRYHQDYKLLTIGPTALG